MANESTAQFHVRKNQILTSQLLAPVSLNGSGAKLQHSSQKRKKDTPRKRKSKWGGDRIENYEPQSSKSIVKPGMAYTGLVLERSTRSPKEIESSKPNWDMKQDGLKILSNRLVIWIQIQCMKVLATKLDLLPELNPWWKEKPIPPSIL